jgi:hypothetical protein
LNYLIGDLFDYYNKPNHYIVIPTNGTVGQKGLIMGKGIAKQAATLYPSIRWFLASVIQHTGNIVTKVDYTNMISFPTKHDWHDESNIPLIEQSSKRLASIALKEPTKTFLIPKVGCGNGGLLWCDVEKVLTLTDNMIIIDKKGEFCTV